MAASRNLQRLHTLIWTLVYGGLLTLVLGLATARIDSAVGWTLVAVGGVAAAVGVVLIGVRARLKSDDLR
jgi:hypothetical protein